MKKSTLACSVPFTFPTSFTPEELLPPLFDLLKEIFIPFLIGVALLVFIISVTRFFTFTNGKKKEKKKAKTLAIYSISTLVFLIVAFVIIDLLTSANCLDSSDVDFTKEDFLKQS